MDHRVLVELGQEIGGDCEQRGGGEPGRSEGGPSLVVIPGHLDEVTDRVWSYTPGERTVDATLELGQVHRVQASPLRSEKAIEHRDDPGGRGAP
jgi:hypothetical protein